MQSGIDIPSSEESLTHPRFKDKNVDVYIKRDDLIHPVISGNKYRKLHLHIEKVRQSHHKTLLTFGGAYSNHIAATAAVGKLFDFNTLGVIRGEEIKELNPTLAQAREDGMQLHFYSRSDYKLKHTQDFKEHIREVFGATHIVAEGGADFLGVNGAMTIAHELHNSYDYVLVAAGTGTTAAALRLSLPEKTHLVVVPVLKNGLFLLEEIDRLQKMVSGINMERRNISLYDNYHFGGYAKVPTDLMEHARNFHDQTGIKTDLIYTAKATYALLDLIEKGEIPEGSRVLFVHTGGLQGNAGIEKRLKTTIYS